MPKKDEILGALAGIFLGTLGLAVFLEAVGLRNPKCPLCNKPVQRGVAICPYCRAVLEWK